MSNPYGGKLSDVLRWKFPDATRLSVNLDDGSITAWEHPTLPEPDPEEFDTYVSEYKALEVGQPPAIDQLREFLIKEGYDADAKVSLLHKRLTNPTPGAKPKLDSVETWMTAQQTKALAGETHFEPKPYELKEVLAE